MKQFTVEAYHRMIREGLLASDDRCELVRGVIVEKPKMNPPHAHAVRCLRPILAAMIVTSYLLDSQLPITLSDSEPEPDLFISSGRPSDYHDRHPGPADLALVVEVSDTSLAVDQTTKLEMYAASNVVQYWIVNVKSKQIEVYTKPKAGVEAEYRSREVFKIHDFIAVILDGQTVGTFAVKELF